MTQEVWRVCSECRSIADPMAERCEWCGLSSPDGWVVADGDPWLGRYVDGCRVVQQLPIPGVYRVEKPGYHFLDAQFFVLNRLHTPGNWLKRVDRLKEVASSRYFLNLMGGSELDDYGVILYAPPGGTLLSAWREAAGAVDDRLALEFARQILCALAPFHRNGMHHGQLNTGSIVIAMDHGEVARLVTLGRLVGLPVGTERSSFLPETPVEGPSDDVYAVGALLYWLVTGHEPSKGVLGIDPARRLRHHTGISKLIARFTSPERPTTAEGALTRLEVTQMRLGRASRPTYATPAPVETSEHLPRELCDPVSGEVFVVND